MFAIPEAKSPCNIKYSTAGPQQDYHLHPTLGHGAGKVPQKLCRMYVGEDRR